MYADALRGVDSTGVYMWSKQKKVENKVMKKPEHALDFLWSNRVQRQFNKLDNYNLVLGHNRAATRGEITRANAHPFQDGDICMVHNGTLHDKTNLPEHSKYSVDSRAICHAINKIGIDETCKLLIGSFTLVWVDHKDKSLNFLRNDKRPLSFAYSSVQQCLYWASEDRMLDWILHRNGILDAEVMQLKEDTLVRYELDASKVEVSSRNMEMYQPPKWSGVNHNNYYGSKRTQSTTTKTSTSGTTQPSEGHLTTTGQKSSTKSGASTTRALSKVVEINSFRRAPQNFPKIGDMCEIYIHDRIYDPDTGRYCTFGYTWDEVAAECECHNIKQSTDCTHEGLYEVKILNVVWNSKIQQHVALCGINRSIELDDDTFDNKQGDAVEGEYLPKVGLTDKQHQDGIEEVIELQMDGKKREADMLLSVLMEGLQQKKNVTSSKCHGTGRSTSTTKTNQKSKEVIIRPTPDEVLSVTTAGISLGECIFTHGNRILGPNGEFIEQRDYDHLTRSGCVCCTSDITWRDAGTLYWIKTSESQLQKPVCKVCCTDRAMQEDLGLDIPLKVYLSRKKICKQGY